MAIHQEEPSMTKARRKELTGMFQSVPQDQPIRENTRRPDREGKSTTIFQVPEAAKRQLAYLAIDESRTQQSLLIEALNDLFKKYSKPPIA
jgi:hypothetical protein